MKIFRKLRDSIDFSQFFRFGGIRPQAHTKAYFYSFLFLPKFSRKIRKNFKIWKMANIFIKIIINWNFCLKIVILS